MLYHYPRPEKIGVLEVFQLFAGRRRRILYSFSLSIHCGENHRPLGFLPSTLLPINIFMVSLPLTVYPKYLNSFLFTLVMNLVLTFETITMILTNIIRIGAFFVSYLWQRIGELLVAFIELLNGWQSNWTSEICPQRRKVLK